MITDLVDGLSTTLNDFVRFCSEQARTKKNDHKTKEQKINENKNENEEEREGHNILQS